jgi:hypothetical protein
MHLQCAEKHLAAGVTEQNTKGKSCKHCAYQNHHVHRFHDSAFAKLVSSEFSTAGMAAASL